MRVVRDFPQIPSIRMDLSARESFRNQACVMAQLRHPHIIGVHEFGIEDDVPYLVMEYFPKGTLRTLHPKGTRLSLEEIIAYVKQNECAWPHRD